VEYNLEVAQQQRHVEIETQEDQSLKAIVEKNLYDVYYHVISDSQIHMTVINNGKEKKANAYVASCPEGKIIFINGRQYQVCDLEGKGNRNKKNMVSDLPDQITPPMPAIVVKIFVHVGDIVKKGQNVIAVSAMKMETTLYAPFDGTVTQINCAINDKVAPGQILVEIQKEGDL